VSAVLVAATFTLLLLLLLLVLMSLSGRRARVAVRCSAALAHMQVGLHM